MSAKYLKISVNDSKYTKCYRAIGEALLEAFRMTDGKYPNQDDLEILKPFVCRLWSAIENISNYNSWTNASIDKRWVVDSFFENNLVMDIVELSFIPESENLDSIYIPLFDESDEILLI